MARARAGIASLATIALVPLLSSTPPAVVAQPAKVYRIGMLSAGSAEPSPYVDAFRQGLRELGYVEGQNLVFDDRFADGMPDRLPGLAAELVRGKVDVILAINTPAARAAKAATASIPIVFTWVADPLSLVTSLARPGENITGQTTMTGELSPKRLGLLREALPGLSRLAVLWNSENPAATRVVKDMEAAAPQFRLRFQPVGVRGPKDVQGAIEAAARGRAGALIVVEEAMLLTQRRAILELAARHRLPTAGIFREFAEAGGLLSYGVNLPDLFRQAARQVDRILRGAKPGDLPVEQPRVFELVINGKTARALGLTIPPAILARADQVLE